MGECNKLGKKINNVYPKMVAIFQNLHPRPGQSHYKLVVSIKSGYSRTTNVESELHTRIAARVKASMNKFVAKVSASLETEVKASLKSSVAIQNTREKFAKQTLYLDLTKPVYVYQVQYSSVMADGTTLD